MGANGLARGHVFEEDFDNGKAAIIAEVTSSSGMPRVSCCSKSSLTIDPWLAEALASSG